MEVNDILKLKLKPARKLKGLTQDQLSEIINIDTVYYGRIENGRNVPSVKVLMKLVDVLDLTLDDIVKPNADNKTYQSIQGMLKNCDEKELKIIEGLVATIIKEKAAK